MARVTIPQSRGLSGIYAENFGAPQLVASSRPYISVLL
jgi:hypothetical protein